MLLGRVSTCMCVCVCVRWARFEYQGLVQVHLHCVHMANHIAKLTGCYLLLGVAIKLTSAVVHEGDIMRVTVQ